VNNKEIAIATITWARDAQEYDRLRQSMQSLSRYGIPIVATDGGSGREFVDYLDSLPNIIVRELDGNPSLLNQVKRSLVTARQLGVRHILYTESDKKWFFEHRLADFIAQAPISNQTGVVTASRTAESLLTFPELQRYAETVANQLCARIVAQDGDFAYGPMIINTAIVPCLDLISEEIGWGWRFFTIVASYRMRLPIAQVTLDLPCPIDQREEDEKDRIHRMRQLAQNVQGMALAASTPIDQMCAR